MKVRSLVPLTHPETGEPIAADTEVDVSDEVAADWRADGKVATVDTTPAPRGEYSARTGREDVASTKTEEPKEPKAKEKG